MKPFSLTLLVFLIAPICMAQTPAPIYEPAAVIGGPFWGFDVRVPDGQEKYNWWGFYSAFKTKTLVPGKIWWYNGIQYGDAFDEGPSDNWGGNSRVVFKGEDLFKNGTAWISTGWYNRIAQHGTKYGPGITAYFGASYHFGSGLHFVGEYGWSDRGDMFQS